jgi:hypothetical protein
MHASTFYKGSKLSNDNTIVLFKIRLQIEALVYYYPIANFSTVLVSGDDLGLQDGKPSTCACFTGHKEKRISSSKIS